MENAGDSSVKLEEENLILPPHESGRLLDSNTITETNPVKDNGRDSRLNRYIESSTGADSSGNTPMTTNRPKFVKPKMQSFGKMGSVAEEYLNNRKARLDRLRKQMVQRSKPQEGREEHTNDITETKKQKPLRNVFTRMEEPCMQQGPFSIIYQSMKKRKRALIDVDEVFRPPRPKAVRTRKKRKKKSQTSKDRSEGRDTGSIAPASNDADITELSDRLQSLQHELAELEKIEKHSDSESAKQGSDKAGSDLREKLNKRRVESKRKSDRNEDRLKRSNDERGRRDSRSRTQTGTDSCRARERSSSVSRRRDRPRGDSSASTARAAKPVSDSAVLQQMSALRERHVNQLFIRGDNVVMVAYA